MPGSLHPIVDLAKIPDLGKVHLAFNINRLQMTRIVRYRAG
jgi:hypothetical protein